MDKDIELLFLPRSQVREGVSKNYLVSKIAVKDEQGRVFGLLCGFLNQESVTAAGRRSACGISDASCDDMLNSIPALIVDAHGRMLHGNDAFLRRFALDASVFRDVRPLAETASLTPCDAVDTLIRGVSGATDSEPAGVYVRHGRNCFWATARPIFEGGVPAGILVLLTDVGLLRRTQERLKQLLFRCRRRVKAFSALRDRMAARLLDRMGERLRVERFSGGTCYCFDLCTGSVSKAEQSGSAEPAEPIQEQVFHREAFDMQDNNKGVEHRPNHPPARILVVDDVEENRALLGVILSKLGYEPVLCGGGGRAVEHCRQEAFDLVLMDIRMPDLDGLEATRQIRAESLNTGVPIIAMTASSQKEDELAALESGCDDYLSKPVNRRLLEQKVWRNLAKMRQIQEAEQGLEITSFLEGDPDYHKTIETFVGNLPGRIEEMRQSLEKGDMKDLAFKVHALKGLGGFAGFAVYTEKAARLEASIHEQDVDKIQAQIDEMVQMCMRTKTKSDTK